MHETIPEDHSNKLSDCNTVAPCDSVCDIDLEHEPLSSWYLGGNFPITVFPVTPGMARATAEDL